MLCTVALHAEPLNESAVLVSWAAKGTPPYTIRYWLADVVHGQANAVAITRQVSLHFTLFVTVEADTAFLHTYAPF